MLKRAQVGVARGSDKMSADGLTLRIPVAAFSKALDAAAKLLEATTASFVSLFS